MELNFDIVHTQRVNLQFERTELAMFFQSFFKARLLESSNSLLEVIHRNLLIGALLNLFALPNLLPPHWKTEAVLISSLSSSNVLFGIVHQRFESRRLVFLTWMTDPCVDIGMTLASNEMLNKWINDHQLTTCYNKGRIHSLVFEMKTGSFRSNIKAALNTKIAQSEEDNKFINITKPTTRFSLSKRPPLIKHGDLGMDYIKVILKQWNMYKKVLHLGNGLFDFMTGALSVWKTSTDSTTIRNTMQNGVPQIYCKFLRMLKGDQFLRFESFRMYIRIGDIDDSDAILKKFDQSSVVTNSQGLPEPLNLQIVMINNTGDTVTARNEFVEISSESSRSNVDEKDLMSVATSKYSDKIMADIFLQSLYISKDLDVTAAYFYGLFMRKSTIIMEKFWVSKIALQEFNLGDHLFIICTRLKIIALSVSKSPVNYGNLLRYIFAFRNLLPTTYTVSIYIIGDWQKGVHYDTVNDILPRNMNPYFQKYIYVKKHISTFPGKITEISPLSDNTCGPQSSEINDILTLHNLIGYKDGIMFDNSLFSMGCFVDFPNPDITPYIPESGLKISINDLAIVISRLLQLADAELYFSSELEMVTFLKSYMPHLLTRWHLSSMKELQSLQFLQENNKTFSSVETNIIYKIKLISNFTGMENYNLNHKQKSNDIILYFYRDKSGLIENQAIKDCDKSDIFMCF